MAKSKTEKPKETIISGKRKTAVAKLKLAPGSGQIFYNGLPHTELPLFHKLALLEPLRIFENEVGGPLSNNFVITTMGGGREGQIQAARLALAKALVHVTASDVLRKAFLKYDKYLLIQDSRRKEARKPGDSKARARTQTSYR